MSELNPGDVIVQGKFHALMWVGGEKPIVHNVDKGQFHGVIQQSLKGAIGGSNSFFSDTSPTTYVVYRCSEAPVAIAAKDFAVGWATPSGSAAAAEALEQREGHLKTKYSHDRMTHAEYHAGDKEREWSVGSMFRALKAYARYEEALTPKEGSSCSQFITYCYQAASIRVQYGDLGIPDVTLGQLKKGGGFVKLSNPTSDFYQKDLITQVTAAKQIIEKKMLPAILVNAKTVYVGSLLVKLNAEQSGFTKKGYLIPDLEFTKAVILDEDKAAVVSQQNSNTMKWSKAMQALGFI